MKTLIIIFVLFISYSYSVKAQETRTQETFKIAYIMSEEEMYKLADNAGLIKISAIVTEVQNEGYSLFKEEKMDKLKEKLKGSKKIISPRLIVAEETILVYSYKDKFGDRNISISVPQYITIADAKNILITAAVK